MHLQELCSAKPWPSPALAQVRTRTWTTRNILNSPLGSSTSVKPCQRWAGAQHWDSRAGITQEGAQVIGKQWLKSACSLQPLWKHKRCIWGARTKWKGQNNRLLQAPENIFKARERERKKDLNFWSSTQVHFFLQLVDTSPSLLISFPLHWKYTLSSNPSSAK